jgi:glycerol-3-phosphate dehydrogenase (NAD(P)+)
MSDLAVIGGGSWGTALALILAPRFESVRLWVLETDLAETIGTTRENPVYLPGFQLPPNVRATSELRSALTGAQVVLSVVPSAHLRHVYQQMLPYLSPRMLYVSATKGIENGSLLRMSEVIAEVLPFDAPVAVISGPTFAREVARGAPTALVAGSTDTALAGKIQRAFSGPTFRLYTNNDPAGVEIGGAVKNVIAIGAGVCHGLGLGANALAALITRGLAEIGRLAAAAGGQPKTLAGLAGLGDLVLTCNGELSRNRSVGLELAKGRKLPEIVASMRMVAEGVETTRATVDLAHKLGVEMPIAEQMHAMLNEGRSPEEAIRRLMERELKGE